MPDLQAMYCLRALRVFLGLERSRLCLAAASPTVPAGSVISQSPVAGTQVATGSEVALVISSGSAASLAVDTVVSVDSGGTVVTPPFSTTAAGELLVAFASSDGPTTTNQTLEVSGVGKVERLERACERALCYQSVSYKVIRSILERGLDTLPEETPTLIITTHENIRGSAAYQ